MIFEGLRPKARGKGKESYHPIELSFGFLSQVTLRF